MRGAIVVLSCSVLAALSAGLSAQEDGTERDAARKLMAELGKTWARHDPVALAELWLPDGDYVNAVGQRAQGREELVQLFRTEHQTYMKGTSLIIAVTRSRLLAPGLVLVDATADLTGVHRPFDGSKRWFCQQRSNFSAQACS